ncbi:MAG TPA: hypothetical protein VMB26_17405 [Candidatus Binataceae bacterium]|nr:hypothetical protein [Candidatus Binataceae bacterium]
MFLLPDEPDDFDETVPADAAGGAAPAPDDALAPDVVGAEVVCDAAGVASASATVRPPANSTALAR